MVACSFAGIHHQAKNSTGPDSVSRLLGSQAFTTLARMVRQRRRMDVALSGHASKLESVREIHPSSSLQFRRFASHTHPMFVLAMPRSSSCILTAVPSWETVHPKEMRYLTWPVFSGT